MKKYFILIMTLIASACSQWPEVLTKGEWLDPEAREFSPSVNLMIIPDAKERNGEISYGSGSYAQLEFKSAMEKIGVIVVTSLEDNIDKALVLAKDKKLMYVMKVQLVEWEDNETFWNGKPDVAAANLDLYSVVSGEKVATAYCRKKGIRAATEPMKPDRFVNYIATEMIEEVFHYVD